MLGRNIALEYKKLLSFRKEIESSQSALKESYITNTNKQLLELFKDLTLLDDPKEFNAFVEAIL